MIYLDLDDLLHIAQRVLGEVLVRDMGLLEAACARPQATAYGEEVYTDLHVKAAALLHSLARSRSLVDGNKRLALTSTIAFLGPNGVRLRLSNKQAYDLVIAVASGKLDELEHIARLSTGPAIGLRPTLRQHQLHPDRTRQVCTNL